MSNVDKIRARVAAMLKMTEANGATESEAATAMAMAEKLMIEYGITLADIREKNSNAFDFVKEDVSTGRKRLHEVDLYVSTMIAKYCDVITYRNKPNKNSESTMVFFGYSVDVELAKYIREVCIRAAEYEYQMYIQTIESKLNVHGRRLRTSFMAGMCGRLVQRLKAMKGEQAKVGEKNALVVAKTALVKSAFDNQLNLKLRKGQGAKVAIISDPFAAGQKAGDKVKFNRAVHAGASSVKLIA